MQRITRDHLIGLDSADLPAAAAVSPGESIVIETSRATEAPFLTGPVEVVGLQAGDTLAITVDKIMITGDGVIGFAQTTAPSEPWGGVLRHLAAGPVQREVKIIGGADGAVPGVRLSPDVVVPVRPMIGWIGLILPNYPADPWDHGGNLDTTALTAGATLYLHDSTGSGRFLLGDLHAAMGEGEVSGMGVEVAGSVRLTIEVLKQCRAHRPMIMNEPAMSHLCSRFTERDAYAQCVADAAAHLAFSQSITFEEANAWLGAIGDLRVSTVVSHSPTYRLDVPSHLLRSPAELLRDVERQALPYLPRGSS